MTSGKSSTQVIATIEKLFEDHFSIKPEIIEALPVSGSDRRYFRINGGDKSAISALFNITLEYKTLSRKNRLAKMPVSQIPFRGNPG